MCTNLTSRPAARRLFFVFSFTAAACAGLGVIHAAQADTAWVSTNTRSMASYLTQAAPAATLPATQSMRVLVGLKLQNTDALATMTRAIATPGNPAYGQLMSAAQFDAAFAPTAAQAQSVADYLTGSGLTNVSIAADRQYVTAQGTPAILQAAFNTTLASYTLGGRTVFANVSDAQVPASLGDLVISVIGLNDIAPMSLALKHAATKPTAHATPDAGTPSPLMEYTPPQFQIAYDAGTTSTASGTTIAIFAEGDLTQVLLDLRTAEKEHMQPEVPYTVVYTGSKSPDTSGADEFDLDTQTSSGMAQQVNDMIVYDNTSLNDVDLIPGFNQFVIDNQAQAGSASFGGCELTEMTSGAIPTYDQIFHKAFMQGQTVFSSSGDNGGACAEVAATGVPDTGVVSGQNYPCSSPYVMCVGGTSLTTDAEDNYVLETAWVATGGGSSEVEPPEFWQYGIVPASSAQVPMVGTVPLYKGVPDLAMDADNNLSPAVVVVDGADTGVGGTSLSSPLALGVWARFLTSHCLTLGNAAPLLYGFAIGTDATTGTTPSVSYMHDIMAGTNGLYAATPGWDYVTGLGTFDISVVDAAIPKCTAATTGGGSSGGSSTGSSTGGTSGGSTSTTGGSSGGSSSGGSGSGGSGSGGSSTGSSGGGGTTGSGGSSGSSTSPGTTSGSGSGTTQDTGGSFAPALLPFLALAAWRRRRLRG